MCIISRDTRGGGGRKSPPPNLYEKKLANRDGVNETLLLNFQMVLLMPFLKGMVKRGIEHGTRGPRNHL